MPFQKGQPRPAKAGRRPGSANKTTVELREAFKRLLDHASPNFVAWLDEIPDPEKRFEICSKFSEYLLPKLGRTELTGADGKELKASVTIVYPKDSE